MIQPYWEESATPKSSRFRYAPFPFGGIKDLLKDDHFEGWDFRRSNLFMLVLVKLRCGPCHREIGSRLQQWI
jgi:hypothetical protein